MLDRAATEDSRAMLRTVLAKTQTPKPAEDQQPPVHTAAQPPPAAAGSKEKEDVSEVSHEVLKKVLE